MSGLRVEEFGSGHVDEVEAVLRGVGAPSWFQVDRDGDDGFSFASTVGTDGELLLARYAVSGSWTLRAEPDLFLVATASSNAMRWSKGDERGFFTDAPVHFPPGRNDVQVDGSVELFEVQFQPDALARLAADAHGVEHVRLGAGVRLPRTPRHEQYWPAVLHFARTLFDGGLLSNAHLLAALKSNLVVTMLDGFSLMAERREWRLSSSGARTAYRQATAFIEEEASRPIAGTDVAAAVGVPFAMLEDEFRQQSGLTIAEHLRRERVVGAHRELLRAEPDRGTAEAVVRRWGFTSLATYLPLHASLLPDRPLPLEP